MTVPQLVAMKAAGQKIRMLTAYDYPTAAIVDAAGVDAILVGEALMRAEDPGEAIRALLGR